jgi:hypothetical protein
MRGATRPLLRLNCAHIFSQAWDHFVQEVSVASIPTIAELRSTIVRMEGRYRRRDEAELLFDVYEKLGERFEQDLADERDLLLSKAAAMMMIKYWVEQSGSHP